MTRLISMLFILSAITSFSQELERQVIGSTNKESTNGGITIQSTIGETAIQTKQSGNLIITEGFQQPQIREIEGVGLKVYTGITPNGDGLNDLWIIDGILLYPENKVIIYGRWGEKVWEGENYNNTNVVWDGKDNKGNQLTDGTYIYYIKLNNGPDVPSSWVQLTN